MNAMIVIRSKNGYIVTPYTAEMPTPALDELHIATAIEDSGWNARGKTVADVLKGYFEPPELAPELDGVTKLKAA
jgi:hypothetical protein